MKICMTASASLVIGLVASMACAEEKPQRAERCIEDSNKGGATVRQPADIASKMLSEFDTDEDGMLNGRELTAMFEGMRDRLKHAKNGQRRAGQGRMGHRRSKADGGAGVGSGRDQSSNGLPSSPKSAGVDPGMLNKVNDRNAANSTKRRARGQSRDRAQGQRPGGVEPEPNTAQ